MDLADRSLGSDSKHFSQQSGADADTGTDLGEGGFGEVYRAYLTTARTHVAVKRNKDLDCRDKLAIEREIAHLERVSSGGHDNVVRVYGICLDAPDGLVRIVMKEYADGSLFAYLRARASRHQLVCRRVCVLSRGL